MPSRIRFSAPTDGLEAFDSISEIVELGTPVRLAELTLGKLMGDAEMAETGANVDGHDTVR